MTLYDGVRWDSERQLVRADQLSSSAAPYDWPLMTEHQLQEITTRFTLLDSSMGNQLQLIVPHGYELNLDTRQLRSTMVADQDGNYHIQVDRKSVV